MIQPSGCGFDGEGNLITAGGNERQRAEQGAATSGSGSTTREAAQQRAKWLNLELSNWRPACGRWEKIQILYDQL